ncbi:F-box/LRR-repeat protein 13-like [Gossypium australe]|uniref:F-box/LRR-repeat protein 13-like n=1 Tax=Gossypium australe TaxID=47621 RepID=A0A5B6UUU2_9ROSI|nr:F-box/LRR-repeat protein 13-like [Gossypium australe]
MDQLAILTLLPNFDLLGLAPWPSFRSVSAFAKLPSQVAPLGVYIDFGHGHGTRSCESWPGRVRTFNEARPCVTELRSCSRCSSRHDRPYPQEKKQDLEEMLTKFIAVLETRFQNTETTLKNQQASIQGIENQLGQLAKLISERPQGSLPSNTETNPNEQLQAITAHISAGLDEPKLSRQHELMKSDCVRGDRARIFSPFCHGGGSVGLAFSHRGGRNRVRGMKGGSLCKWWWKGG